jgi:glycosidase
MFQLTVRGVPCMYYGEEIGMTDAKFPFASALDPIPHKFAFAPRFVFDLLGVLINRDEVRTPMQWDGIHNAGFSSAPKTWLPVHENYPTINVEKQQAESDSLLNIVRTLLKLRQQEKCLQEGSLELLDHLPSGVLGYTRILEGKKVIALLNFEDQEKEFQVENSGELFNLSAGDRVKNKTIHLAGYGGLLLSHRKP